ncbi:ribosome maturation factor RimM [Streptantibioticus silvisoli]|uniref:Ribosome maturation factor RimM n=1 Tax=Streptantibioticus silvisoli TaxID=2705255 RepID=A0ABT6WAN5_9ACTN|nr:ribosome maturation factor RimM [Streptantibioticus silvisoli]MDI5967546.1 ribosome maturation factor RimM [Streptantibioticus silvisoli]
MQLVVGRIGRAHGIKGEVTVEVRTDEPELRLGPGAVLATDPAATGPLTIATGRVHSGRLLLRFEGVADRTGAEGLRNTLLIAEVDPEQTPDDPEEYYDHQLVDLDVVTTDGTEIGRIAEISHLPYQDLLIVRRPDGSEVMIPFVSEIVPEIDLDAQRAVVDPPPGLLDGPESGRSAGGEVSDGEVSGGEVSNGEVSDGEADNGEAGGARGSEGGATGGGTSGGGTGGSRESGGRDA